MPRHPPCALSSLTTRIECSRTSPQTLETDALIWISDPNTNTHFSATHLSRPHPASTIFSRSSPWENAFRPCRSTTHQHSFKMPITTTKLSKIGCELDGRSRFQFTFASRRDEPRMSKSVSSSEPSRISTLALAVKRPEKIGDPCREIVASRAIRPSQRRHKCTYENALGSPEAPVFSLIDATAGIFLAVFSQVSALGQAPVLVVVGRVDTMELAAGQAFVGTVLPARTSDVGIAIDGRIVNFPIVDGQKVVEGEPIAELIRELLEIERQGTSPSWSAADRCWQSSRPDRVPRKSTRHEQSWLASKRGLPMQKVGLPGSDASLSVARAP